MKSLFEEMGGTYRQEGDYLIPNLALPDEPEYQIGKYGRMRRSYLKEHRPVLYASLLTSGTLHWHLAEIDQACNERMEIIVSDMARQEGVTEALKAADQLKSFPLENFTPWRSLNSHVTPSSRTFQLSARPGFLFIFAS